jgi:hypothetical protein
MAHTPDAAEPLGAYLDWLRAHGGYRSVQLLPNGRWAGVLQFMFSHAIVCGRVGDDVGYDGRWCYDSEAEALAALEAWDGTGEPDGWRRHPDTGRRRAKGAGEYADNGAITRAAGEIYVRL